MGVLKYQTLIIVILTLASALAYTLKHKKDDVAEIRDIRTELLLKELLYEINKEQEARSANGHDACGNPPVRLAEQDQTKAVEVHDYLRGLVGASNMQQVTWDNELAMMAQNLADKCVFEHNNTQLCSNSAVSSGQNIFVQYLSLNTPVNDIAWSSFVDIAITNWYNEVQHYTLDTHTCDTGAVCGHYTQVVWAQTTKIGCAANLCHPLYTANSVIDNMYGLLFVCNYLEPGNYQGVRPYTPGPGCSNCASVVKTSNAICLDNKYCEECPDNSTDTNCKTAAFTCFNGGSFNYQSGVCDCVAEYFGVSCKNKVSEGCFNGATYNASTKSCACTGSFCGETCADEDSISGCPFFKSSGYCEPGSEYYTYVTDNCKCEC